MYNYATLLNLSDASMRINVCMRSASSSYSDEEQPQHPIADKCRPIDLVFVKTLCVAEKISHTTSRINFFRVLTCPNE